LGKAGKVYLVGAGPGDPELITQRAFRLIGQAEVIFYDNLVNPQLLQSAHPEARLVYVGKRGEGTSADQKEIEDRIVTAAREGKKVVRLKGGDPFIFGRGGEEAERLAAEGIPFEVVPGVTSPIAVPAYAGIPLTHRNFTHTVVFVTGHKDAAVDWNAVARMETIVFVMGVKTVRENMEALINAGKNPETPVALIRWGTYPRQKTMTGTVGTIADEIEKIHLMPPAVIVVGEVVRLREKINWYETLPLFGKKIVVTRARRQASELTRRLRGLGAEVIEIPTIETVAPPSWKEVDGAIDSITQYDWIFFTSANGVEFFLRRLEESGRDVRVLSGCKLAVVGPATAEILSSFHLKADRSPPDFSGEALGKSFSKKELEGKKLLFPGAKEGRGELAEALRSKGAQVEVVTAYETRVPEKSKEELARLKDPSSVDLITFASSSAVKNFYDLLEGEMKEKLLEKPCLCIGPSTQATAKDLGFVDVSVSKEATIASLIERLMECFKSSHNSIS
jgi:uroporphyrinogen III methyltransferase / synthase